MESTAVLEEERDEEEEENVPAPPPEFSGAGSVSSPNDDADQDTEGDVEEALSSLRAAKAPEGAEVPRKENAGKADEEEEGEEEEEEGAVSPLNDIPEEITTTSQESTVKRRQPAWLCGDGEAQQQMSQAARLVSSFDQEVTFCAGLDKTEDILGSVVTLESPPTVFAEDSPGNTAAAAAAASGGGGGGDGDANVKIAEMYVRLASSATSSSTNASSSSSSANTTAGATSNSVPFIGKFKTEADRVRLLARPWWELGNQLPVRARDA